MTGQVEIKPFDAVSRPPALFITVERAVVRLSQAAMGMLSREIVAHAKRKYATEIDGVYWRIEADLDNQDDLETDVFGPTTLGYLVEETAELHQQVDARTNTLEQTLHALNTDIATGLGASTQAEALSRHVREKAARRRDERRLAERSATTTREVTPCTSHE